MRFINEEISAANTALKENEFVGRIDGGVVKWYVARYATPDTPHQRRKADCPDVNLFSPGLTTAAAMTWKEVTPVTPISLRAYYEAIDPGTGEAFHKTLKMTMSSQVVSVGDDNRNILAATPAGNYYAIEKRFTINPEPKKGK